MLIELDFGVENGEELYQVIYDGIMQTEQGFVAPTETRVIGAALTKLETIGSPEYVGEPPMGFASFRLLKGISDLAIVLESAEYDMVAKALSKVTWKSSFSRQATTGMDWFEETKEIAENKEKKLGTTDS